jgi:hypothetical protein
VPASSIFSKTLHVDFFIEKPLKIAKGDLTFLLRRGIILT